MMDILQALRFSTNTEELDSLLLIDYWQDCDSNYARRLLQQRYGQAIVQLSKARHN
jgi:hypothetical protein